MAVTCARASKPTVALAQPTPPPASPAQALPTPAPSPIAAGSPLPGAAPPESARPLATFHAALADLAAGRRKAPVRVVWLGDSHTAADYYPDALRRPLQERYGDGGPGFVYVGARVYRHGSIDYERQGNWALEPRAPSTRARTDDGVFGLGGIRAVPKEATSQVTVAIREPRAGGLLRWEVVYRLPDARAQFSVSYGQRRDVLGGKAPGAGTVERHRFETQPDAKVVLHAVAGEPRIFGIVIERDAPGVIVDTLGINGARVDTPLAWDESAWIEELGLRTPSLVVMAYGSNEVLDLTAPRRYADSYRTLIGRIRKAAPDTDCVLLGLPDQTGPDGASPSRVFEIEAMQRQVATEIRCAFVSALEAMGGEGSFSRWAGQSPPLAQPDHIHLTPRGYKELGTKVAAELLPGPG